MNKQELLRHNVLQCVNNIYEFHDELSEFLRQNLDDEKYETALTSLYGIFLSCEDIEEEVNPEDVNK